MYEILDCGLEKIDEIIGVVKESDNYKKRLLAIKLSSQRMEKELSFLHKKIEAKKKSEIETRRAELEKSFNDEISANDKNVHLRKNEKKRALKAAIDVKIAKEEDKIKIEQQKLNESIIDILKSRNVPKMCCNSVYKALYFPRTLKDYGILFISLIVAFGAIPNLACVFLPLPALAKAFIYLAIAIFFLFLYGYFYFKSKIKYADVFNEVRHLYDLDALLDSKRLKLKKNIKKDGEISEYNLSSFDEEIKAINEEIGRLSNVKELELKKFDEQTSREIIREIDKSFEAEIAAKNKEIEDAKSEFDNISLKQKDLLVIMASEYEVPLGKENLNLKKLQKIKQMLEEGKAASIGDALR